MDFNINFGIVFKVLQNQKFDMMLPRKQISNRPQFISIQGNIGSGKSTVLKIIRQNFPELTILDQPLSEWQNVGIDKNVNLLEIYYSEPKRWGFTFQIYAFMSRVKKWAQYSTYEGDGVRISERSLLSDRFVFASIMRDMDILDESEHQIYLQCYQYMLKIKQIANLSGIIYIRCSPQICEQRIKKRSRQGQDSIPLDYLERLHQKHENWLNNEESEQTIKSDVLVIDNTKQINKQKIIESIALWIEKVKSPSRENSTAGSQEQARLQCEVFSN